MWPALWGCLSVFTHCRKVVALDTPFGLPKLVKSVPSPSQYVDQGWCCWNEELPVLLWKSSFQPTGLACTREGGHGTKLWWERGIIVQPTWTQWKCHIGKGEGIHLCSLSSQKLLAFIRFAICMCWLPNHSASKHLSLPKQAAGGSHGKHGHPPSRYLPVLPFGAKEQGCYICSTPAPRGKGCVWSVRWEM